MENRPQNTEYRNNHENSPTQIEQAAKKAQVSLCICSVSPELLLIAHTKYATRCRSKIRLRHQASLDSVHTPQSLAIAQLSPKCTALNPFPAYIFFVQKMLSAYYVRCTCSNAL